MKSSKLIFSAALFFVFAIAMVFVSCDKSAVKYGETTYYKPCEGVVCLNGGNCLDGYCQCPVGFEGTNCEIRSNEKFYGNYEARDMCYMNGTDFYNVSIDADPNLATKLVFNNIGTECPAASITGFITSNKSDFQINSQNTCGDIWISGNGNMNGNIVNVYLAFRDSVLHQTKTCSIVLNKK